MRRRTTEAKVPVDDLAAGIAELDELLIRLCKGDSSLRAVVESENDIFSGLKAHINQLADYIQETNDYSHEMAIGLSEDYEVLNRIAQGDFSARVTMGSGNEVVAKLGELINLEADTLTSTISRAQRAEEESRNSYQQLLDIVEFLPDATFVVDKEKRVIAWNRAIEKLTGLKKKELIGKGDYIYAIPFYGKPRPILIDLLDEDKIIDNHNYTVIKKEGRTLFTEAFVPSFRNGGSRYFWATASPLLDKNGKKVGAIESIRDITEYKQGEAQRLRLESRLHYARMIESFMIRLGHDMRTPLTPLTILLPLIRKQVADPDLLKLVDICCKSAVSMKKLADKAQLLGSLSTAIKTGELESVTLASLVELALADSADILAQKNISCQNVVDPDIVVNVIPDQIKETFANLISNAVHFSLENGVIRIDAKQQNGTVTVSVQDNGIGLHPGILEHIFDEFFKADESRHDLDAPGLGLTICKRIVRNHHGRIWAESPGLGKGTTIKFTINEKDDNSRLYVKEQ